MPQVFRTKFTSIEERVESICAKHNVSLRWKLYLYIAFIFDRNLKYFGTLCTIYKKFILEEKK